MGENIEDLFIDGIRRLKELKVVELRCELEKRGLAKYGTKKELLQRLAIFEESRQKSLLAKKKPQTPNQWLEEDSNLANDFIRDYFKSQKALLADHIEPKNQRGECDAPTPLLDSSTTKGSALDDVKPSCSRKASNKPANKYEKALPEPSPASNRRVKLTIRTKCDPEHSLNLGRQSKNNAESRILSCSLQEESQDGEELEVYHRSRRKKHSSGNSKQVLSKKEEEMRPCAKLLKIKIGDPPKSKSPISPLLNTKKSTGPISPQNISYMSPQNAEISSSVEEQSKPKLAIPILPSKEAPLEVIKPAVLETSISLKTNKEVAPINKEIVRPHNLLTTAGQCKDKNITEAIKESNIISQKVPSTKFLKAKVVQKVSPSTNTRPSRHSVKKLQSTSSGSSKRNSVVINPSKVVSKITSSLKKLSQFPTPCTDVARQVTETRANTRTRSALFESLKQQIELPLHVERFPCADKIEVTSTSELSDQFMKPVAVEPGGYDFHSICKEVPILDSQILVESHLGSNTIPDSRTNSDNENPLMDPLHINPKDLKSYISDDKTRTESVHNICDDLSGVLAKPKKDSYLMKNILKESEMPINCLPHLEDNNIVNAKLDAPQVFNENVPFTVKNVTFEDDLTNESICIRKSSDVAVVKKPVTSDKYVVKNSEINIETDATKQTAVKSEISTLGKRNEAGPSLEMDILAFATLAADIDKSYDTKKELTKEQSLPPDDDHPKISIAKESSESSEKITKSAIANQIISDDQVKEVLEDPKIMLPTVDETQKIDPSDEVLHQEQKNILRNKSMLSTDSMSSSDILKKQIKSPCMESSLTKQVLEEPEIILPIVDEPRKINLTDEVLHMEKKDLKKNIFKDKSMPSIDIMSTIDIPKQRTESQCKESSLRKQVLEKSPKILPIEEESSKIHPTDEVLHMEKKDLKKNIFRDKSMPSTDSMSSSDITKKQIEYPCKGSSQMKQVLEQPEIILPIVDEPRKINPTDKVLLMEETDLKRHIFRDKSMPSTDGMLSSDIPKKQIESPCKESSLTNEILEEPDIILPVVDESRKIYPPNEVLHIEENDSKKNIFRDKFMPSNDSMANTYPPEKQIQSPFKESSLPKEVLKEPEIILPIVDEPREINPTNKVLNLDENASKQEIFSDTSMPSTESMSGSDIPKKQIESPCKESTKVIPKDIKPIPDNVCISKIDETKPFESNEPITELPENGDKPSEENTFQGPIIKELVPPIISNNNDPKGDMKEEPTCVYGDKNSQSEFKNEKSISFDEANLKNEILSPCSKSSESEYEKKAINEEIEPPVDKKMHPEIETNHPQPSHYSDPTTGISGEQVYLCEGQNIESHMQSDFTSDDTYPQSEISTDKVIRSDDQIDNSESGIQIDSYSLDIMHEELVSSDIDKIGSPCLPVSESCQLLHHSTNVLKTDSCTKLVNIVETENSTNVLSPKILPDASTILQSCSSNDFISQKNIDGLLKKNFGLDIELDVDKRLQTHEDLLPPSISLESSKIYNKNLHKTAVITSTSQDKEGSVCISTIKGETLSNRESKGSSIPDAVVYSGKLDIKDLCTSDLNIGSSSEESKNASNVSIKSSGKNGKDICVPDVITCNDNTAKLENILPDTIVEIIDVVEAKVLSHTTHKESTSETNKDMVIQSDSLSDNIHNTSTDNQSEVISTDKIALPGKCVESECTSTKNNIAHETRDLSSIDFVNKSLLECASIESPNVEDILHMSTSKPKEMTEIKEIISLPGDKAKEESTFESMDRLSMPLPTNICLQTVDNSDLIEKENAIERLKLYDIKTKLDLASIPLPTDSDMCITTSDEAPLPIIPSSGDTFISHKVEDLSSKLNLVEVEMGKHRKSKSGDHKRSRRDHDDMSPPPSRKSERKITTKEKKESEIRSESDHNSAVEVNTTSTISLDTKNDDEISEKMESNDCEKAVNEEKKELPPPEDKDNHPIGVKKEIPKESNKRRSKDERSHSRSSEREVSKKHRSWSRTSEKEEDSKKHKRSHSRSSERDRSNKRNSSLVSKKGDSKGDKRIHSHSPGKERTKRQRKSRSPSSERVDSKTNQSRTSDTDELKSSKRISEKSKKEDIPIVEKMIIEPTLRESQDTIEILLNPEPDSSMLEEDTSMDMLSPKAKIPSEQIETKKEKHNKKTEESDITKKDSVPFKSVRKVILNRNKSNDEPKKQKWGSSSTSAKSSMAISSFSLKALISDVRPLSPSELQLGSESEKSSDNETALPARKKVNGHADEPSTKDDRDVSHGPASPPREDLPRKRTRHASKERDTVEHRRDKQSKYHESSRRDERHSRSDRGSDRQARSIQVTESYVPGKKLGIPASRNPISRVIAVANLVRPFTVKQLKDLLQRTGSLSQNGFWIDNIKSKCIAMFEKVEQAEETRIALHGVKWPSVNPKHLLVDYSTEDDLQKKLKETPHLNPIIVEDAKFERRKMDRPVREWDLAKVGEASPGEKERERERKRRDREEERAVKERRKEYSPKPERTQVRKPVEMKSLDDLFFKTKAQPSIYWLPLSTDEIAEKEALRRKKMAEQERKEAEMKALHERARAERMKERQRRRDRSRTPKRSRRSASSSRRRRSKSRSRS